MNERASLKLSFLGELQRRNVHRAALFYAGAAWLLVQVATQVFPFFEIPNGTVRIVVFAAAIGFPFAMLFSWFYEWTPQGIRRESEIDRSRSITQTTGKKLDKAIIAVLGLAVVLLLLNQFVLHRFINTSGTGATNEKSIAVLPFENLSRDPDNAYFAEGIQDEILTRLAKIGALKVISRTSTQQYAAQPGNLPDIARQLGVANILEGSVQKIGETVHVNVQLIRAATDDHLWAESYNRKLDDVFGVEAEVAQTVAETLRAKLSGAESQQLAARPTSNPAAYEAYLRGLAFEGRVDALGPNTLKSITAYAQAVQLDPGFALAWARLAQLQSFAYIYVEPTPAHRDAARAALEHAKKLDPDSQETQLAEGFYRYWVERDYEGAKARFAALHARYPNDSSPPYALAAIARRQGEWALSRRLFDAAIELNPQDVFLLSDAAGTDVARRDSAAALKRVERALELSPGNAALLAFKAAALQLTGDIAQAQIVLDPLHPEAGDNNVVSVIVGQANLSRHYAQALAVLETQLRDPQALGPLLGTFENYLGDVQRHTGAAAAAAASYHQALTAIATALHDAPESAELFNQKAWAEAGLGDAAAALADERRAIALLPASKDALAGPAYEENLARIQARFGDRDKAIAGLRHLLGISYGIPPVSTAQLRLDPDWDGLRGDPRFERLAIAAANGDAGP